MYRSKRADKAFSNAPGIAEERSILVEGIEAVLGDSATTASSLLHTAIKSLRTSCLKTNSNCARIQLIEGSWKFFWFFQVLSTYVCLLVAILFNDLSGSLFSINGQWTQFSSKYYVDNIFILFRLSTITTNGFIFRFRLDDQKGAENCWGRGSVKSGVKSLSLYLYYRLTCVSVMTTKKIFSPIFNYTLSCKLVRSGRFSAIWLMATLCVLSICIDALATYLIVTRMVFQVSWCCVEGMCCSVSQYRVLQAMFVKVLQTRSNYHDAKRIGEAGTSFSCFPCAASHRILLV